jgi:hypothetical protein
VQNSLWTCITGHVKTTAEVFWHVFNHLQRHG